MKSRYRVSLYFNPLLNGGGASIVNRAPLYYNGGYKLICKIAEYETLPCSNFDAAEFVFDCKNSRIPLIEDKKSCVPPLTKLGDKAEVIKRWRLRHEI